MGTRESRGNEEKEVEEEGLGRELSKESKAVLVSLRWFL